MFTTRTPCIGEHQVGSYMGRELLSWMRSTLTMQFLPLCVGRGFGFESEAAKRHEWPGLTN